MTTNPPRSEGTNTLVRETPRDPKRYNAYLEQYMKPFVRYFNEYKDRGLIEVCVNRPGEVWLETKEDGWICTPDPAFSLQTLNRFANSLGNYSGQEYDQDRMPLLFTELPNWGFRVALAGRGVVSSGFACSMRVALASTFDVASYFPEEETKPIEEETKYIDGTTGLQDLSGLSGAELARALCEVIRVGSANVIVAGGTKSGKTTFINSIIRYIDPRDRLIVIEDTKEIDTSQKNQVRFLKSKTGSNLSGVTYEHIVNLCMRMAPDRLLLGELDTGNIVAFLTLLNSGHGGCITTIHATSPEKVYDAMATKASMDKENPINPEYVRNFAKEVIKNIIYLDGNPRGGITARHVRLGD
ncbi:MAG: Flp pilus assembly complex ATPase component TadA [Proteobacteria bacterium]|nr:Flp pilus assembly complex ATPase component TadA [Pseudomonadota bacterium]